MTESISDGELAVGRAQYDQDIAALRAKKDVTAWLLWLSASAHLIGVTRSAMAQLAGAPDEELDKAVDVGIEAIAAAANALLEEWRGGLR